MFFGTNNGHTHPKLPKLFLIKKTKYQHKKIQLSVTLYYADDHNNEWHVSGIRTGVVCVQTQSGFSQVAELNGPLNEYYNATKNWNELQITDATAVGQSNEDTISQRGVLLSASAGSDIHVYGVKSDKGTGDGFMVLPLTEKSTEFFIAAWK